jgi:glycosyltransferase involved in cell wall biosynthesis
MRYIYDKYNDYFGQHPWSPSSLAMRLLQGTLQRWDRNASRRVTAYMCNGVHVAQRIQHIYQREAVPVGAPVDRARFQAARDLIRSGAVATDSRPYFLTLSALEPYKRVDLCVEAFRRLGPSHHLKVAGSGSQLEQLRKLAPPNVEFLGWVPDQDLTLLLAGASALVFPADEDFGIVPLEAAAAGVPTLALAAGGSLETVVEGVTGLHFIRQKPEDIAAAVLRCNDTRWNTSAMEAHAARYDIAVVRNRMARVIRLAYEQQRQGLLHER